MSTFSGPPAKGWDLYKPQAEFARMGVPNAHWVPTSINNNYEVKKAQKGVAMVFSFSSAVQLANTIAVAN